MPKNMLGKAKKNMKNTAKTCHFRRHLFKNWRTKGDSAVYRSSFRLYIIGWSNLTSYFGLFWQIYITDMVHYWFSIPNNIPYVYFFYVIEWTKIWSSAIPLLADFYLYFKALQEKFWDTFQLTNDESETMLTMVLPNHN